MTTRAVNAAAGVIAAAMEQGKRTPAGLAFSLESAQLLQSPETAAEFEKLLRWHREDGEQIAKLVAQRERRRARLVALQNDALNVRGALSPNGEESKVPFPLGETLTPAVEWLINRVAELEAERHSTNEALDDAAKALRANRDRIAELERQLADAPLAVTLTEKAAAGIAPTQAPRASGSCSECGMAPEEWCPGCAKCKCVDQHDAGCPETVKPQVAKLRALLAGQRTAVEDPHDSPLHHSYRVPRELPQTGGA